MYLAEAEFVAGVGAQGVILRQLLCDLAGERAIKPTVHVDLGQLLEFVGRTACELDSFALQVRGFRVCLRADGHVLAGGHRHGSGHESSDTREHHLTASCLCRSDAYHEAGGRDDAIVRSQDRSP
jgi:hypothetical protein